MLKERGKVVAVVRGKGGFGFDGGGGNDAVRERAGASSGFAEQSRTLGCQFGRDWKNAAQQAFHGGNFHRQDWPAEEFRPCHRTTAELAILPDPTVNTIHHPGTALTRIGDEVIGIEVNRSGPW